MLLCERWYLAYDLSLRDLEEMMAERGLSVDHSTVHRWVVHFSPQLLERYNRRKQSVTGRWMRLQQRPQTMDVSTGGRRHGGVSENRDLSAAKRFFRQALACHGRPDRMVIDGSDTNHAAVCLLRCGKPAPGSVTAVAEADPHPVEPMPQQPGRAGSPAYQAKYEDVERDCTKAASKNTVPAMGGWRNPGEG